MFHYRHSRADKSLKICFVKTSNAMGIMYNTKRPKIAQFVAQPRFFRPPSPEKQPCPLFFAYQYPPNCHPGMEICHPLPANPSQNGPSISRVVYGSPSQHRSKMGIVIRIVSKGYKRNMIRRDKIVASTGRGRHFDPQGAR